MTNQQIISDKSMQIEKQDVLELNTPALSSTSDMPVIETKPDATPAETPEKEVETKTVESATTATEEQPGATDSKPYVAKGVQKRLDELTQQRNEERAEKLRLLAMLESQTKPVVTPETTETEPVKPARANYPDQDAWDAALMAYAEQKAQFVAQREVRTAVEQERRAAQERAATEAHEQVRAAYSKRVEAAKTKYADFSEVAASPDVAVPMAVAHAIVQSEDGPELQYYFGKNPGEAKRLMDLTPAAQLVELGKIVAKLGQPDKPKIISNAPPPINALKKGEPSPKEVDLQNASMDEYVAARRKAEVRVRH